MFISDHFLLSRSRTFVVKCKVPALEDRIECWTKRQKDRETNGRISVRQEDRKTETLTDIQTDRKANYRKIERPKIDRQIDIQAQGQKDQSMKRQKDRNTERQKDKSQINRQTDRQNFKVSSSVLNCRFRQNKNIGAEDDSTNSKF